MSGNGRFFDGAKMTTPLFVLGATFTNNLIVASPAFGASGAEVHLHAEG